MKSYNAFLLSSYLFLNCVIEKGLLDPDGINPYINSLIQDIFGKTELINDETYKRLDKVIDGMIPESKESVTYSILQMQEIIAEHGGKASTIAPNVIYDHSEKLYRKVKTKLCDESKTPFLYDKRDEVAIDRVNKYNNVFIGDHYKDDVTKKVESIIRKGIEEEEGALDRKRIARKLKREMKEEGIVEQKNYFQIVTSQVLNVSRSYSNLRFYEDSEIQQYEIVSVLDERTSDICKYMNGKIFNVSKSISKYSEYDNATNIDEVKNVNPWLKSDKDGIVYYKGTALNDVMTGSNLQEIGINMPPYHALCRTTVVPLL